MPANAVDPFAAFAIFVGKIANTREFLIGRANGLAIIDLDPAMPFAELAETLRDAPLVAAPGVASDPARHPTCDVGYGDGDPLGDMHLRVRDSEYELFYDATLFSADRARRLARCYAHVLRAPGTAKLGAIAVLSEAETAELIDELSTPIFNWPKYFTLHELFESRADQTPDAIALAYGDTRVTYRELEQRANAVAADLIRRGVGADAIVALLLDRSSEMIVAMLGVLKAGAAYLPIEPDAPEDRIKYLLEDSGARAVISSRQIEHGYVIHADDVLPPADRPAPQAQPHHLAYVIYTSGSTGQPKGVLVEHRNVVHLIFAEKEDLAIRASDALILLSSYTFDASIDQIWLALTSGAKLVLVDKSTLLDPQLLASVIHREQVTHLDTVPALLAELPHDLPSVRQIVVGGEACPVSIARSWSATTRFWNEYGPTETTVGSLRHRVDPAIELGDRVPIGRPIGMTRVYVLDWGGCPTPIGVRGELCIGGAGVARGYLNRAQLTNDRFVADPFAEPGARMYRSGDLVAWLPDGSLEFFGRVDSQVKVRGFRIELGEIEAALLRYGEVTGAAASVLGSDRLVAHVVASRELDVAELRAHLAKSLPQYMIPDFFVQLDAFPRTVSGKIDRKSLPAPQLDDGIVEPPANRVETELRAIWSKLLGFPAEQIGVTRSFFELGGHSLRVMQMLTQIKEALGVALTAQSVLEQPTIRAIAAAVGSHVDVVIPRAEAGAAPPATSVQRRMYVIQQGNPRSTSYNLPLLYAVDGSVTVAAIASACAALVDRHESLRTAFFFQAGEILQKTSPPRFELETIELGESDPQSVAAAFVRPFRLEAPPLFRAAVLMRAGQVAFLALDMHHIIADGTSIDVLLEDLLAQLAGEAIQPPALRYIDYAAWVASPAGAAQLAAGKAYWQALLRDELPVLELPYDFRRPLSRQQAAGELTIDLPQATLDRITAFSRAREATPFAFYSAVYAVFLSCLTGSEDVVFGYPSAGRPHPDFERTVGMFVNSLPFRAHIDADDTFDDLVRHAMQQIRDSLRAEDYPFEDMVADRGATSGGAGRNPIFDTMLSYEGAMPAAWTTGGVTLREVRLPQRHARMDLVATIRETPEAGATLRFEYSADLFKRSTIERFARDFVDIVDRVLADRVRLEDLHTVDAEERHKLLHGFNDTAHELPAVHSVHELFEQHVDAAPDAIAVEMWDMAWSYAEVERRANALAHLLIGKGLGRDQLVAIQLDPCPEMLVAVLGVLKAGAAFLPIDPEYPLARKQHMLKDSAARVILTRGSLSADVATGLVVVDLAQPLAGRSDRPVVAIERADLAYVIYTSGSTGLPKGTLIEHRGLVNFSAWYADYFAIRAGDGVAKYAGFGFDASISEIVPCFISGARLVIVPAELRLAVQELDTYFADHRVAIAFLPTQFGEAFLRTTTKHSLRAAFLGGEKLRNKPTDRLAIINGYGPTEYTVAATAFTVDKAYDNIPIGKPLWNTQVLVLDRLDRLCPIGVAGELCIAGTSIARGYLNRAELTAEKFVAHPFDNTARPGSPHRKMYRTGDLARWLEDGNLEFLGRIDTQVKVRGFRVELGEIEQALLALSHVTGAVVVARENPAVAGDIALIAFVTGTLDEAETKTELGKTLPAYMVPARIVLVPEIPLTANGKVDKRRLPEVEVGDLEVVAPRDAIETELRELFADVLGRPAATISIHASFLELGGHSLKAAVLLSALYQRRGIQLRFAQFLAASSVAELAGLIATETKQAGPVWDKAPDGPLPLTSSQLRMYAVNQLSSWSTAYNIPFAWELAPELDAAQLVAALQALVPRHHALRARFIEREGAVVQEFGTTPLEVGRIAIEDASLRSTLERFTQPFDLAVAPLMRAAIITTPTRRVLALDIHHIVADGLSVRLLLEDLEALYRGSAEPLTGPSFADYAHWEAGPGGIAQRDSERAWWLERFAETPSPLELPVDFDRPPRLSFDGDEVSLELPAETGAPLVELAKARGITPLGVFLGAYAVLLSRLGNTTDVVIGVPAAGRQRAGMERMVGMFVNTVPLRIQLRADEPFGELCVRIGTEATEAFERQTYQLNDLVADLGLARDPSRNPLFDVLFAWEEAELVELEGSRLGLHELPQAQAPSKFDLELTVQNTRAGQKISLLFAKKLFKRATAERFIGNLRKLLEQVARSPDAKIRELRMLQPWERELLLSEFNDTEVAVPRATMADLFARHVAERPNAIAVQDAHGEYTFAEVDRRASQLALALIARGVVADDVVALAMHRSRELLVAFVGIWKAGAGYLPIEPDAPLERVAGIVEDSRARVMLSQGGNFGLANVLAWDAIDFSGSEPVASRSRWDTVAYVIYTSGSTGKPKGVVIEHRNVVSFLTTTMQDLAVDQHDRVLLFSSFTFDASVEQIGLAIVAGGRLVIPTKDVLLDHDAFEAFVHRTGVTHLDTVPLFLSGFQPKQPLGLRRVVVGGDICPVPVAQRWGPLQAFFNEYGPTETTITSLRHTVTPEDYAEPRIPVGRPIANTKIYILDWTGNLAPLGVPGEMYIGGAGVARGYLNNETLTRERFVPNPYAPGERMYKTGDIARWLPEGTVDFLGRADNQIKIRGFRIELGEIEATLLRHAGVGEAAVIAREINGDKRLVGYAVLRDEPATRTSSPSIATPATLRSFLARSLPAYMVPDAIVILQSLPVTTSGKIDRKRLPEPVLEAAGENDAPATLAEEKLIEIWAEILKLSPHQIPVEKSFFELGGHSLLIMMLIARIQQTFTVRLTAADVFDAPTVRQLGVLIAAHAREAIVPIPRVDAREHYPLSSVQRRLFAIHQMNPVSVQYNMPTVFAVEGRITPERLEELVRALIHRHASLRTSFHVIAGEPAQRIHATAPFDLRVLDSDAELDDLMQRLMQPFDLAQAPLWRVWLVRRSSGEELLVVDIHHIIADGYASGILWRETSELLRGVSLPAPRITVGDYAVWQQGEEHRKDVAKQREFWLAQFATLPAPLQLPYDFRHPAVRSHAGDLVVAKLPFEELEQLNNLSRAKDSTLFATLLASWFVFMSRIGGTDDVVVGVPVAGRTHPDLHDVIGMFVNTVAWRAQVPTQGTFADFISATRETSLKVLASEDYQLEDLLDALAAKPLPGRNPLFDVMFVFETRGEAVIDAQRVKLHFRDFKHSTAKMDLTLIATESPEGLELAFEYATELFERSTIERLAQHFKTLLRDIAGAPHKPIAELALLTERDRDQLLVELNNTAHELPPVQSVLELFAAHVDATPNVPCVVFRDTTWTYAEVDQRASAIAAWLQSQDIGHDAVVALVLDPCAELLPAMLGVMRAGAAFLPVDHEYPAGRKAYLLEDSKARALITRGSLADDVEHEGPRLDVERVPASVAKPVGVTGGDAAYVIYTSGSTGKPKGVVIEHASLVNFACWYVAYYKLAPGEAVSKYAGFSFDASISEIVPTFVAGGTLVVVPSELRLQPDELATYLETNEVRAAFLPTQFGEQFMRTTAASSLRIVTLAGEKLRAFRPTTWTIVNGYGPTEYTVCTTAFVVDRPWDNIPIGAPVWNTQVMILDRANRLCPIGIAGELCVAGAGIARGYLGRPELTAEKFVAHPFAVGQRMYRTGDLARWRADGNIEYLGRIDSQVKVRGFRIELGEIEQELLAHTTDASVIDIQDDHGATQLAAYYVGEAEPDALREALARHLPEYMIPTYWTRLEAMPLTPNGKVDKRALPAVQQGSAKAYVGPATPAEQKLVGVWAIVLALQPETISVLATFVELGGHSLKAIALVSEIHKAFGVQLRVSEVFRHNTVRAMAERLAQLRGESSLGAIEPAAPVASVLASSVQARMFVVAQMDPGTTYNVPGLFAVAPNVTREDMAQALGAIAKRYDAFRASFFLDGNDVRMRIAPTTEKKRLSFDVITTTEAERDAVVEKLVQPFDLGAAPLARAAWVTTEARSYLFFDMHHIVTDGASMGVLVEDLEHVLAGHALEPAPPALLDCTVWERTERALAQIAKQRAYWQAAFPDGVPALGLVTDLPRPPIVAAEGETRIRALPETTARGIRELAQRHGLSLHAVMLAAFDVFLSRLARQEDIAVGTVVSGRWHPDLQRAFGMFVNTLVLTARVDPKQPFLDLAKDVAQTSLEALDNQAFPFGDLVELVGDGRHAGHTPLVDVMFAMQNADDRFEGQGRLAPVAVESPTAKFDLSLVIDERRDGIDLAIEYRTSLFHRATIDRYLACIERLLADICEQPEAAIEHLVLIPDDDRDLVVTEWNRTDVDYPDVGGAHHMFERAAKRAPSSRCLVHDDRVLTYGEVDALANGLAQRLRGLGIDRDEVVAILSPPSCELIIAELAALKAGGAFLPLDHRYPRERIEHMLRDSAARVLLVAPGHGTGLDWTGPSLPLECSAKAPAPPPTTFRATDLAYIIYTSGSTGKPKGVALEHAQLVPFVQRTIDVYQLTNKDRHSKYAGIGFDVSIIETFPPLCCGGELHLVPDEIRLSLPELGEWLDRSGVTMMDLPTQLAEELMKLAPKTKLRWMTVGGDRLRRFYPVSFQLANEYGPTEATVSATTFIVDQQYDNIPIGKPNANTKVFILDGAGQPCPPGFAGELCIAGKGLARGYLGAPELTAKKFVRSELADRLYKTGDLARWLADGNIEFLGRIDSQVKIRGFRIELGEIEQAILEVENVAAAVVIDRDDPSGEKILVAYFVGPADSETAIRAHLAARLPDYMMPSAFIAMAAIPFTTSGKVDRRRLPEPDLRAKDRVAVAPTNLAETLIVEAFARVLVRPDLGIDDDFFDVGGNSIKAVAVVAALASDFRISANDLFRLRTARAIAREIPMRRGDLQGRLTALVAEIREGEPDPIDSLTTELDAYRKRYRPYAGLSVHQRMTYRDVMLTGATGFLGAYLLRDLLTHTDAKVHVAIRAKTRHEAWDRLNAKMAAYFGPELLEAQGKRVRILPGDLSEPELGLDHGTYDAMSRTIDCVIHAAALTKHYGDQATFIKANVDATNNVLGLARRAGCDVNVVSTVSVGAGDIPGRSHALFTEFDCDIGQVATNHYVRTKLLAEKAVLELREQGLACNIFRVGFLTGDSQTLRFQDNADDSGFVQTLKSYVALGKIPEAQLAQSFCPVNEVSDAILRLMGASSLLSQTHHIDRVIDPETALRLIDRNRVEPLPEAEFFEWLASNINDPVIGPAATAMLLHEGLLDRGGSTATVTLREKSDRLLALSGFAWSPVRPEQIWSLIRTG